MDSWNEIFTLEENEYIQVNVSLYKCSVPEDSAISHQSTYHDQPLGDHSTWSQTSTPKPPLLKNVLGESLFSSLQGFFVQTENEIDTSDSVIPAHTDIQCHVVRSFEIPVLTFSSFWIFVFLLSVVALLSAIVLTRRCVVVVWYALKAKFQKNPKKTENDKVQDNEVLISEDKERAEETVPVKTEKERPESDKIHLSYQCCVLKNSAIGSSNVITFLDQTTDKLFKKLDKLLLRGLADGQSLSQTCPATPRLARRNISRRQRIGSSPMINTMVESSAADSLESKETEEQENAWGSFKKFSVSLQWQRPFTNVTESSTLSRTSQKLLQYYQRVCPVQNSMWKTACLVTDYVMYLISVELQNFDSKSGYRFIQFLGTGSAKNCTKVSRANCFDVLMVVQPPVLPEIVFESSKGSIPPGMVVIGVNTGKSSACDRKLLGNLEIDGSSKSCLSAKECTVAAESLIEDCLHSLYTKSRSSMDRLPFQIKGAPTANLMLNINTRALVGFSEPEIKVRIIPVLPLPINGWYQMPMLYATPPSADYEYKQRSEARGVLNPDLLWQLDCSDFNTVFSFGVDSLMKHARVNSCHDVCLMILKALLGGSIKNNLLDRGVFPSYHIATVLNFLLLESAPGQWTFDKLGDRFSDAVHFLKSAYSCNRLPHFFVNNPHLISKMPAVAENRVLTQQRQQNLLANTRSETLEKRLEYLGTCLRETGLTDCVKDEFSNDMWEFEFFLFN